MQHTTYMQTAFIQAARATRWALRVCIAALLASSLSTAETLVETVKASFQTNSSKSALAMLAAYRTSRGVTPEYVEGLSWVARREFSAKNYLQAISMAEETYSLATTLLKTQKLDRDPHLPLALGAAIEVTANAAAAQGRLSESVSYLNTQEKLFANTSIAARLRKNLLLLTLEGKPAPPLTGLTLPKGKAAILFFWAHWCSDCKQEIPILESIVREFAPQGLRLIAPTQLYGYVAGGMEATAEAETAYIEQIRRTYYASLVVGPAVINENNFVRYGASTTPTLVIVDRAGIVRKYHPGGMSYAELRNAVTAVMQ